MQATSSDQIAGYMLVLISGLIFAYYTAWIVVLPFVEPEHPIQTLFFPKIYAILIPVVAGFLALFGLGIFTGIVMMRGRTPSIEKKAS